MFLSALIISLPIVLAEEYRIDYDANGNIVYDQESNVYREYNELNQLTRTRLNNISGTILQEYTYEPIQERIFIKDEFYSNGSLKSSTYYFDDDYVVIQNSSGTFNETYIYQDGILVGYEDTDGKKRYVLPDHEGSAHIVLDENGNVLEENLFSPFAEPLEGVKESRFSYEAREYDELVQDYDFRFRKYNPNLRIFMQPDTLIQDVYDPQSLNRYSFERSNPYGRVDPTGHIAPLLLGGIIIVGAAIIGGYVSYQTQVVVHHGNVDWGKVGASAFAAGAAAAIAIVVSPASLIASAGIYTTSGLIAEEAAVATIGAGALELAYLVDEKLENKKPEPKKVITEESLNCGLAVDCQMQVIEGQNPQNTGKQPPGTPSTPSTSSQANTAKTSTQQTSANAGSSYYRTSSGGYETISGGRKIGVGKGGTSYNIPASATYSPGFESQLGSGKMTGGRRGGRGIR